VYQDLQIVLEKGRALPPRAGEGPPIS
jgi:hypothetical protein